MSASSDKVYSFPTLEKRALDAMAEYQAGIADEACGKERAIRAVIEYGKVLLEGRILHPSNHAFSAWVADNKLDIGKPWADIHERSKAMMLARVLGTMPNTNFDSCPYTIPTHIMKWYRKTYGAPKEQGHTKPLAPQIDVAYRKILELKQNGKEIPSNKKLFAKQLDLSQRAVERAWKRWRQEHIKEIIPPTETEMLAKTEETFSEKSKLTIADAIRIHQHRLDKMFETKVGEEVRRHIAAADEAMRKQNAQLRKENLAVTMLLRQGAVFTADEYKTILRCLHPDNSASPEVRARAFNLFKQKEKRLVGAI